MKDRERMGNRKNSIVTNLIVLTGGPGAGKTAILEMAKKTICDEVAFLPEAASIVYGGGFWRLPSLSAKTCAQTAIYHIQNEMEKMVVAEKKWHIGICDRGTLDGLAYWPLNEEAFWSMGQTSMQQEFTKYRAIIHLRTPSDNLGYNHQNPLRVENSLQASEIDNRIAEIWKHHPDYNVIENTEDFITKAQKAIDLIIKYKGSYHR
jgi:predicted ATPase